MSVHANINICANICTIEEHQLDCIINLPKSKQYYLRGVVESWFEFTLTKIRNQKITF